MLVTFNFDDALLRNISVFLLDVQGYVSLYKYQLSHLGKLLDSSFALID